MAVLSFPPLEQANEFGLLAVGGDLEVETLLLAYQTGVFPWPIAGESVLPWFSPPTRAVLFLDRLKPSRSTRRAGRKHGYRFSIDRDFVGVISHCQRYWIEERGETWLNDAMHDAYIELYHAGYAHSVECYSGNRLVGGLYGVSIGGMFAGESMFHLTDDASKLSLYYLAENLSARGGKWIDCQVMNPFFEQLGASAVSRNDFSQLLQEALQRPPLFPVE